MTMGEGRVRFVRGGENGMMKAVSCCISPPPRSIILYPRTHTRPDLSFSLLTQITTSSTPSTTTVTSTRATSTVSRMRTVGFRKFRWHAASQYLSFFLPRVRDVTNLTATYHYLSGNRGHRSRFDVLYDFAKSIIRNLVHYASVQST